VGGGKLIIKLNSAQLELDLGLSLAKVKKLKKIANLIELVFDLQ
jgi:hypothetical protein